MYYIYDVILYVLHVQYVLLELQTFTYYLRYTMTPANERIASETAIQKSAAAPVPVTEKLWQF